MQKDFPPDWQVFFGRSAPLAVEVGFGGGESLVESARRHPERNLVGIELPPECVARAARALEREGIENVRLVRGDARYLLRELFPPASLRRVLMQFPMPWPKERHAKHRVSSPRFAATLADVLTPGGVFELLTDQEWYAEEAHAFLSAEGAFLLPPLERNPPRPFLTRYERKWREEGRSTFRLLATLREPRPAPRLHDPRAMLAVHLDRLPSPSELETWVGRPFRDPAAQLYGELKEVFHGSSSSLLRVLSADESFTQAFYLRLVPRGDGRGLLKVEPPPRPYATRAVRFLVESLAEAWAALDSPERNQIR